eukprot:5815809-Alexandrium_andersonii.AAC.1
MFADSKPRREAFGRLGELGPPSPREGSGDPVVVPTYEKQSLAPFPTLVFPNVVVALFRIFAVLGLVVR